MLHNNLSFNRSFYSNRKSEFSSKIVNHQRKLDIGLTVSHRNNIDCINASCYKAITGTDSMQKHIESCFSQTESTKCITEISYFL